MRSFSNKIIFGNWTYHLTKLLWNGIDWLFPPHCGGCGRVGFQWCKNCHDSVKQIPEPICNICGSHHGWKGICPKCHQSPPPYRALRSWALYEGSLRRALLELKYKNNFSLGESLASPLLALVSQQHWPIDIIVPVPLGDKRKKDRGYNQVELLARPLANGTGWEYAPKAIWRTRDTKSQVGLTTAERLVNMQGAFRADTTAVYKRTILLVDDITTTGATVRACTKALKFAGAGCVYVVTLARAVPNLSHFVP